MSQMITRFAPSPTGYLHIGGARTALFNWLLARQQGGKMLLRIEDTDRERSTQGAIDAIIDGMKWLGLDWDGETIFQFARADRHREVALEMFSRGAAYKCYATPAELDEMREKARAEGRPPRYDGRWRELGGTQAEKDAIAEGRKPVMRLKAPREGETIVNDHVQGMVAFPNKDLDDLILLRSDGTPTYMLAVVVDDHDMGVTQIIRGDDHFTNAARQTHIYQAMGWDIPAFAHIPLIHGPDGAKLSKRHGALGVEAYRAMGYLPEALRNYLARLGWSQGDREFFTGPELIEAFSLDQVHRSPARFDFAKLENMNGHYMRSTPDEALLAILIDTLPFLAGGPDMLAKIDENKKAQLLRSMAGLKERAKTLVELADGANFLFAQRPLAYDAKASEILKPEGRAHLAALAPKLEALAEWTAAAAEETVRAYVQETGAKLGQVAQPLRAALTGRATSPGIFDVVEVLGREEALGRIKDASA